jgi:hypothetical protein
MEPTLLISDPGGVFDTVSSDAGEHAAYHASEAESYNEATL